MIAVISQSILVKFDHITWVVFGQGSQGKSFVLNDKFLHLAEFLPDRVAMFTQAMGMSASDWSVSDVVKTSQNNVWTLTPLLSLAGIAVIRLILHLKAKMWSYPGFQCSSKPQWVGSRRDYENYDCLRCVGSRTRAENNGRMVAGQDDPPNQF